MNYRIINRLAAALVLVGAAQMAQAAPTWYECDLTGYGRGFTAPKPYFFGLDTASGKGHAMGPGIHHFNNGKPIEAPLKKRGANGYRINYDLNVKFKNNKSGRARFDVTYYADKSNLMMSVDFPGADNHGMGARGRCVPAKPKK